MQLSQTEVILRHEGAELARVQLPPGEYVIGRSPGVAIHASTPLLSRQHARLIITDGELLLEDLGSSNGTFVAEQRISDSTPLLPNQVARLGDVQLEIQQALPPSQTGPRLAAAEGAIERLLPPEVLAEKRYAIGGQVARGGMGAILDAQQAAMKRRVAMKVMLRGTGEADVLRFIEEAQITGQLEHPNIVPVHELGLDEQGQLFYTMKMVRGITLRKVLELLQQGIEATVKKYPLPVLLTIFQKSCDALAFAHNRGVLHRDFKPENIMLGDFGEVLVMDWGLAKVIGQSPTLAGDGARSFIASARGGHGDTSRTMSGTIMGTPAYMSPEQARGEVDELDARSDIYALGALLFHLLFLRAPYTGKGAAEIVEKVQRGAVEWPKSVSHVPESLVAICRKALALERGDRYQNVAALQRDLQAYQTGFATSAESTNTWKQVRLLIKRNKAAAVGIAAVLVVGAILGTQAFVSAQKATRALHELSRTAPTFLSYAQTLIDQQRFDEALAALNSAAQLDPYSSKSPLLRAHVLQTLQRFDEAIAAYRAVLQREPELATARHNLPLTQAIAAQAARGPEEKQRALALLQADLTAQERIAESTYLVQHLASDADRNYRTWKPVIEKLGIRNDLSHFAPRPDGTLRVFPDSASFADLGLLRSMPIGDLQLGRSAVTDLSPLEGMPLEALNAGGNPQLKDISALRGLPLRRLNLSQTAVRDLEPLRGMQLTSLEVTIVGGSVDSISAIAGMPLTRLVLSVSPECDLNILRGMPLEELTLYGGHQMDISVLRGAPLRRLSIYSRSVTDLEPLRNAPLTSLNINGTGVKDLSPLRGKALEGLDLSNTVVADLSPIAGTPLKSLHLTDCKNIRDLSPVFTLASLEKLTLPAGEFDLEPLRRLPKLKFLGTKYYNGTPTTTVEEFWKAYDEKKSAAGK